MEHFKAIKNYGKFDFRMHEEKNIFDFLRVFFAVPIYFISSKLGSFTVDCRQCSISLPQVYCKYIFFTWNVLFFLRRKAFFNSLYPSPKKVGVHLVLVIENVFLPISQVKL